LGVRALMARTRAILHIQVGPGIDVSACGLRGSFAIAHSQRQITCAACRVKYAARFKNPRSDRERAARKVFFEAKAAKGQWFE
jgi:hypothetical protein